MYNVACTTVRAFCILLLFHWPFLSCVFFLALANYCLFAVGYSRSLFFNFPHIVWFTMDCLAKTRVFIHYYSHKFREKIIYEANEKKKNERTHPYALCNMHKNKKNNNMQNAIPGMNKRERGREREAEKERESE